MPWDHVLSSEIITVTSAMRRNQRWSITSDTKMKPLDPQTDLLVTGDAGMLQQVRRFTGVAREKLRIDNITEESPLMHSFAALRAKLSAVRNLRDLDPLEMLKPFLEVVKSGDTNGYITGAALQSIEKLLTFKVIDPHHPDVGYCMAALSHAVTRCKFEATDVVTDEIVLSRIVRLIRAAVLSEAGRKSIDDKSVCEMMEVAFGMHFQGRISELLRKAAEDTLLVLVQVAFERLGLLTKELEHRDAVRSNRIRSFQLNVDALRINDSDGFDSSPNSSPVPTRSTSRKTQPFGLPAIIEITRVLISLIDPFKKSHTDSLHRSLALRLLRRALEVSGSSLNKWVGYGLSIELKRSSNDSLQSKQHNFNASQSAAEVKISPEPSSNVVNVGADGHLTNRDGKNAVVDVGSPNMDASPDEKPPNLDKVVQDEAYKDDASVEDTARGSTTIINDAPALVDSVVPLKDSDDDTHKDIQHMAAIMKNMITGDLPKFLLLLLQKQNKSFSNPPSWQGVSITAQVLDTLCVLLNSVKDHLLLQQEWLVNFLIAKCKLGVPGWDIEEWATTSDSFSNTQRKPQQNAPTNQSGNPLEGVLVGEIRELYLNTLLQLSRSSHFFTDLFVYYDCNIQSKTFLFEDLIGFFSKYSFPDATPGGPATTIVHQNLCVDGILIYLKKMAEQRHVIGRVPQVVSPIDLETAEVKRIDSSSVDSSVEGEFSPKQLIANRKRKHIMLEGAQKFNESSKIGISFFQCKSIEDLKKRILCLVDINIVIVANGFLPDPLTPQTMGVFLATTPNLSKQQIGEYLAKPQHVETLKYFVETFEFHGKRIDEAMRTLLEKFRLPGESQQIERIMDAFSTWYFKSIEDDAKREIKTQDDTSVLAFSIIMLNTDQHNPQVKRRMTFHDYSRNVRGLNSGEDFSSDYLKSIYDAIKHNEIVMAEEKGGELGFNYQWRGIMKNADSVVQLSNRDTSIYNCDMFTTTWGPVLAALFYTFDNAEDQLTMQKAILGIQHCSILAAQYELNFVFDFIILSLIRMTGLNKESRNLPEELNIVSLMASTSQSTAINEASNSNAQITSENATTSRKKRRSMDNWVYHIAQSYKSQVAAVLVFNLASDYGNLIREAWKSILSAMGNLFLHQVLPKPLLVTDHFTQGSITIPRVTYARSKTEEPQNMYQSRKEAGIFSTLSHFLSLGSPLNYENDEEDYGSDEAALEQVFNECIASCRIDEILADTRFLEEHALNSLVLTLIKVSLKEQTLPRKSSQIDSGDVPAAAAAHGPTDKTEPIIKQFTQPSAFYLEILFKVIIRNRDRIKILWPMVSSHIDFIFTNSLDIPNAVVERCVNGILQLTLRVQHIEGVQDDVFSLLEKTAKFHPDVIAQVADTLVGGLLVVLKTDMSTFAKPSRWSILTQILSSTASHPTAGTNSFEAACIILSNQPDSPVCAENFGECVDLLLSYSHVSSNTVLSDTQLPRAAAVYYGGSSTPAVDSQNDVRLVSSNTPITSTNTQPLQSLVERGVIVIDKLSQLQSKIPTLVASSGIQGQRVWFEFWLPVLSGISQLCHNPSREVRQHAIGSLQRCLISGEFDSIGSNGTSEARVDCFDSVMFPLLDDLLKYETSRPAWTAFEETRVRTVGLCGKLLLRFSSSLVKSKNILRIWMRILNYCNECVRLANRDYQDFVVSSKKMIHLLVSHNNGLKLTLESISLLYNMKKKKKKNRRKVFKSH